jgi:hypothetical protein
MSDWFANLDTLHRAIVCALSFLMLMGPVLLAPDFVNYSNRKIAESRVTYEERDD